MFYFACYTVNFYAYEHIFLVIKAYLKKNPKASLLPFHHYGDYSLISKVFTS